MPMTNPRAPGREPWRPVVGRSEWTFRALITPSDERCAAGGRTGEAARRPLIPDRPGILPAKNPGGTGPTVRLLA